MAQTFTIDDVPATLAAFDRVISPRDRMVALARAQRMENEEHEAAREQRKSFNVADLQKLLKAGNLEAPVFFLPRTRAVRADKLWEVLQEASEYEDFQKRLITLLFFASEGVPKAQEYARELLRLLVDKAAESGVEA